MGRPRRPFYGPEEVERYIATWHARCPPELQRFVEEICGRAWTGKVTLGQKNSSWPTLVKGLLAEAEKIGIYPDVKGAMSLKHDSVEGPALNLGTIRKDGFIDTNPSSWWGRNPSALLYHQAVGGGGGLVGDVKAEEQSVLRTATGRTPRIPDLLPGHQQLWLDQMQSYVRRHFDGADRPASRA